MQSEADYRSHRQTERMMKTSRLTHKPQMEDFDWTTNRSLAKIYISNIYDMSRYLEELAIARSTNSYLKYLNKLAKPQLLIIDDFGLALHRSS